jgi:hypothetical protein
MAGHAPQVIVIGPPGAGKGTQAARLAERLGLVHINPGRILREEAGADSEAGQRIRRLMTAGELVPEELVDRLVRERLEALSDTRGSSSTATHATAPRPRACMRCSPNWSQRLELASSRRRVGIDLVKLNPFPNCSSRPRGDWLLER